jgi:hypothetical protein
MRAVMVRTPQHVAARRGTSRHRRGIGVDHCDS